MSRDPADVDAYLETLFTRSDATAAAVAAASRAAGLDDIAVSPLQGAFLMLLAKSAGAKRILEIGALGGYSTVWLARAAGRDGRVVTLEIDAHAAEVVRGNAARAGFGAVIDVVLGPAAASLERMIRERTALFDFVFIDADKEGYPDYLRSVMSLVRPGALIVADNVVRDGKVADAASADSRVEGARAYLAAAAADPRLETTVIQTVGVKGHDGFALSRVKDS